MLFPWWRQRCRGWVGTCDESQGLGLGLACCHFCLIPSAEASLYTQAKGRRLVSLSCWSGCTVIHVKEGRLQGNRTGELERFAQCQSCISHLQHPGSSFVCDLLLSGISFENPEAQITSGTCLKSPGGYRFGVLAHRPAHWLPSSDYSQWGSLRLVVLFWWLTALWSKA